MLNKTLGEFGSLQVILLPMAILIFIVLYFKDSHPRFRLGIDGIETEGLITSFEPREGRDVEHSANAYEFKSADGVLHYGKTESPGMLIGFEHLVPVKPGRKNTVVYLKDDPGVNSLKGNVTSMRYLKIENIVMTCIGGLFLLTSAFLAWMGYRIKHPKPIWDPMAPLEIIPVIATTEEENIVASAGGSGLTWKGYCKTHKLELHDSYLTWDEANMVVADHEDDFPKHFVALKKLVMKDGGPFD